MPESGWNGIGWFRLHLEVAQPLLNVPLALLQRQMGAAEIYLDGKRIHTLGRVGAREQEESVMSWDIWKPLLISFEGGPKHVLAVRYSNSWSESFHRESLQGAGFEMFMGDWQAGLNYHTSRTRIWTINQMLFSGIALAFALLHLLLFAFYPRIKANLYYAIFTASVALFNYVVFGLGFATDPASYLVWIQATKVAMVFLVISGIRFLYDLYYSHPPAQFRLLAAAGIMISLAVVYVQSAFIFLFAMLVLIEMLRVVFRAILRKQDGSWIIGVGFLFFIIPTVYQVLMSINILANLDGPFEFLFLFGILGLFISMSVYLARSYAQVNQSLEDYSRTLEQRVENRTQEVNAKNNELEQALYQLTETQSQLVMQEKMASLGDLVAGVTHELNSPLGAVNSMHDTLTRAVVKLQETMAEYDDNRTIRSICRAIGDANRGMASGVERVTAIVRSLRNFVRLDEAEFQMADIHEGIESTLTLLAAQIGDGIRVVKDYADLQPVGCSPGQLNQVFMHLIKNAIQAVEGNGEIEIRTVQDGETVSIKIRDNGKGIPPEQLERIFDFGFNSTDSRVKMGFGLPTTYKIVQEHKGEIHIVSEVNKGTEVTVSLDSGGHEGRSAG